MAFEAPLGFHSGHLVAGEDLSTSQFRFCKYGSTGVVRCTAVTDVAIGVIQDKPKLGDPCAIVHIGFCQVEAGAVLAQGATIGTSTVGKAIANGTDECYGQLLEASTADGAIVGAYIACAPFRQA